MTALTTTITEALVTGDRIAIPSLGTFQVKERAARTGKNPRTGEAVDIPVKKVPAFKAAKALRDATE